MRSNRARGICLGIVVWLAAAASVATAGEIKITKRYLLLPIGEHGRGASVALVVDGREVRCLGMRLAVSKDQIGRLIFDEAIPNAEVKNFLRYKP